MSAVTVKITEEWALHMEQQLSMPFIGHQSELTYIDGAIQEWGSRRIICIDAPAGGGKTSLLQEVRRRHTSGQSEKIPLLVTEIIDFHNPAFHVPQSVGCAIARMVSEKIFGPYLRVLLNWRRMEMKGEGLEQLKQTQMAVNQTFVNCFNMVSARVVLFFDTSDVLQQPEMVSYMIETVKHLENVVVIIAGRNIREISALLRTAGVREVRMLQLAPLPRHAAEAYIYHRQNMFGGAIESSLVQTIIMLSGGRPVLLDLAVQRYGQHPPPDWILAHPLSEKETLPPEQFQPLQQEFERDLAFSIANTSQLKGWLPLLLARIFPLSVEMITDLLAVPEDTARSLFERACASSYVKQLPDGRICLHSEIQELLCRYVWPEIDPDKKQRKQHSRLAVGHMERQEETIRQRLKQLGTLEIAEQDEPRMHIVCSPFMERTALQQEIQRLAVRQLFHTLYADPAEGARTFIRMFDDATYAYDFRLRGLLIDEMLQHSKREEATLPHAVRTRCIRHLIDTGRYEQAQQQAVALLAQTPLDVERQVELLVLLGQANIRLKALNDGIARFEQAIELSSKHDLQDCLATAYHSRGQAYTYQGKHDKALTDFLEAYQICLYVRNIEQTTRLLNDISYIYALNGDQHASIESCYAALELAQELNAPRELAITYSTLGEIYVRFNQPVQSLSYYTKAMDIFAAQKDIEWMSMVRCGRIFAYQLRNEIDKAKEEQAWLIQFAPLHIKPRVIYSQARTLLEEGDVSGTRRKLEECRQVCQEFGDSFNDYKCFADIVELAWESGEYDRWREFAEEHKQLYASREGTDALRLRGSCLRKIADLAMCNGAYDEALEYYKHGLPIIAAYEIHGRYTIRAQIRQTDHRLRGRIPEKTLQQLGRDLSAFWRERPELVKKYPEVLLVFSRW